MTQPAIKDARWKRMMRMSASWLRDTITTLRPMLAWKQITSLLHVPKQRLSNAMEGLGKILEAGGSLFIALREGDKEGYERQSGMDRWFANYQADEFERYIPSVYRLERSSRADRQSIIFLNYHLVKVGE